MEGSGGAFDGTGSKEEGESQLEVIFGEVAGMAWREGEGGWCGGPG